jgi:conjugal transfer pilus assembly protein TraD
MTNRSYHDMFRPVYETPATIAWGVSALGLAITQPPFWPLFTLGSLALSYLRGKETFEIFRFRASIAAFRVEKIAASEAVKISRKHIKESNSFWLGRGFTWTQKHAEISRAITYRDPDEIEGPPTWLPKQVLDYIRPANFVPLKEGEIGVPWIHGINPDEEELTLPIDSLSGHTLVVGTTRAGKTRLYELLTTQIIHNKNVLIVLDPKGDKDWENRLRKECKKAGRKFLYFHPAHPSKSIRINPIAAWNNLSEPATRIGQLIDAEGTFGAFAWKTLYRIMRGIVAAGEKPTIKAAKEYVQQGVEPLLEKLIKSELYDLEGSKWDSNLISFSPPPSAKGKPSQIKSEKLEQMINKYLDCKIKNEAIESLIAMVYHSKEHYSKMIQVLEPILEMLGSDELGKMLSPDPLDMNDNRPIYDIKKVIEEEAVLYVGLDSLSNKIIGSAIGSVLLADIASELGATYNFREKKDIYLFIDEAAEVMNDQGIQILNKGGGAGLKAFIATQTIADFDVVFGSAAKTKQALGNLNNVIALRVKDPEMASWIAESFGTTSRRDIKRSISSGSGSSKLFTEFTSTSGQSISEEEVPFVTADLLTRLPGLHYFAFVAGSRLMKGRLPLLQ